MKILIDTNIIISSILFPNGIAAKSFFKAVKYPNKPYISDFTVMELQKVFKIKFPNYINVLESFLNYSSNIISIAKTPNIESPNESLIRDPKDIPIYRAAVGISADCILTGDKDLLESSITFPKIISPSNFLLNF